MNHHRLSQHYTQATRNVTPNKSFHNNNNNNNNNNNMMMMMMTPVDMMMTEHIMSSSNIISLSSSINILSDMSRETAEQLAGPFFGLSLFPYLLFLYFLGVPENDTPKGVVVGFATCLVFVFLSIPAAIAAQVLYGVSLADSDWLHGSAESLLTVTNLVTVVAFRQALSAKETTTTTTTTMPQSALQYRPMINLVLVLTALAGLTAVVPALMDPQVHTPYLNGVLDLSPDLWHGLVGKYEPDNALTVACWIIHISSLVEFLVAMGFAWRWADVVQNPTWKGLTWGLIPLHSSGITACTYHLFYNRLPVLVPLQAFLTLLGNSTAAYAAYRIAMSNNWVPPEWWPSSSTTSTSTNDNTLTSLLVRGESSIITSATNTDTQSEEQSQQSLIGFEDLGDALANDNDYTFLVKLFVGCALASYVIKYGETLVDFPLEADVFLSLSFVFVPSLLNALKWYRRSQDATFEGWF